jgi:hypothetical protein
MKSQRFNHDSFAIRSGAVDKVTRSVLGAKRRRKENILWEHQRHGYLEVLQLWPGNRITVTRQNGLMRGSFGCPTYLSLGYIVFTIKRKINA